MILLLRSTTSYIRVGVNRLLVYLYRLSLTERPPTLWDEPPKKKPIRFDFLMKWLSEEHELETSRGVLLTYKPTQSSHGVISGVFGRWYSTETEGDPEDLFATTEAGHWEKAAFFFNANDDHQIIGIQKNPKVSSTNAIMKAFSRTVNASSHPGGFKIDIFSRNNPKDFWDAVTKYDGRITSISFEFILPNPTNVEGFTDKAMKKLRDKYNADRAKGELESDEGLDLKNNDIKEAAKYAEGGGGEITAKSDKTKVYATKDNIKTAEVDDEFRPTGEPIDGLSDEVKRKLTK
nr:hypothetical protein [uncultured bacterium]